jgi:small subunit ribosomal protein S5
MVFRGEISNMREALETGLPLKEPEIVDVLLPDLADEVLDVNMVQRMTDSGRRVNFVIVAVVGNEDGYVGLGKTKGKEVGPAIRKTIDAAKLNVVEVKRGCGSWECGCGRAHSLPFQVKGNSGSVEVVLKPAPRGISLAVGGIAKSILKLAGIKDAWGFTKGHSRTTVNYAFATFDAIRQTGAMKMTPEQSSDLCIISGPTEIRAEGDIEEPMELGDESEGEAEAKEPQGEDDKKVEGKSE